MRALSFILDVTVHERFAKYADGLADFLTALLFILMAISVVMVGYSLIQQDKDGLKKFFIWFGVSIGGLIVIEILRNALGS